MGSSSIEDEPRSYNDEYDNGSDLGGSSSVIPPAVLLATAGYDHSIRFWDVVSGVCTNTLQYNLSQVNALANTSDKRILGAAGNPQVHIFDTTSAAGPIRVLDASPSGTSSGNVSCLGFHSTDPWLYTCGEDGGLRLWDLRAAKCQRHFDNKAGINGAAMLPGQTDIATADQNGSLKIWDLRATACSAEMIPEEGVPLRSVTVNAAGSLLAAANNSGRVYVWKDDEGLDGGGFIPTSKIDAHRNYITKCTFSPCGEYLATASADHTVGLWHFAAPRAAETRQQSDGSLHDAEWARVEEDEDLDDEEEGSSAEHQLVSRHSLEGHLKWVWDCAFSADSAYLVSASSDNTARLWSVSSGDCIVIYTGHAKAVSAITLNDLA